jgi:hypothetical protein
MIAHVIKLHKGGQRPSSHAAHDKHHWARRWSRTAKIADVLSRVSGQVQHLVRLLSGYPGQAINNFGELHICNLPIKTAHHHDCSIIRASTKSGCAGYRSHTTTKLSGAARATCITFLYRTGSDSCTNFANVSRVRCSALFAGPFA